ncbi:MAG: hypothetical protein ABI231_02850 [Candidatus Tumulicola sp.]
MKAVVCEFVRSYVVTDVAALRPFSDQVAHERTQVSVGLGDMIAVMEHRFEFGAMALVRYPRKGLENGLKALDRTSRAIAYFSELVEMGAYLALVPGDQD